LGNQSCERDQPAYIEQHQTSLDLGADYRRMAIGPFKRNGAAVAFREVDHDTRATVGEQTPHSQHLSEVVMDRVGDQHTIAG
jgi:hypothetical protein